MPNPIQDVVSSELELAWSRIMSDRPRGVFVTHPHLQQWMAEDLESWLEVVASNLAAGYSPAASVPCLAPKPGYLIRPGSVLNLEDEIVYAFLVGRLYAEIHAHLLPYQGDPDIAHQLNTNVDAPKWLREGGGIWKQWRTKSVEALAGHSHVLVSDIVGCYDNIEIAILVSDLKAVCGERPEIALLSECLNRWSEPRGRGIPQGYGSSHILAKLYLRSLDQRLYDIGYRHLRYVDDLRIFCKSKVEAQSGIIQLDSFLSRRGLNLQSAKTKILDAGDASAEFDGVEDIINTIQDTLLQEFEDALDMNDPYGIDFALLQAIEEAEGTPVEVLETAFTDHILFAGSPNRTLAHFLLTRLGKAKSEVAIDYCIEELGVQPDETNYFLRYLGSVNLTADNIETIADYFTSGAAIYQYQKFEFVRWCYDYEVTDYIAIARLWAFDMTLPSWVRSYALAILGREGTPADLEHIEAKYVEMNSDAEKADCVAACVKQEKARRNAFYAKAKGDGLLVDRAIGVAKNVSPF